MKIELEGMLRDLRPILLRSPKSLSDEEQNAIRIGIGYTKDGEGVWWDTRGDTSKMSPDMMGIMHVKAVTSAHARMKKAGAI